MNEKVIECGIRFTKQVLELDDSKFSAAVTACSARFRNAILAQRVRAIAIDALASSKAPGDAWASKGIEFYCEMKGGGEPDSIADEKSAARVLALIASRVECGVRIKEYALTMPDTSFSKFLDSATETFELSLKEQRAAYLEATNSKVFDFDFPGSAKGVELYCRIKSMCG